MWLYFNTCLYSNGTMLKYCSFFFSSSISHSLSSGQFCKPCNYQSQIYYYIHINIYKFLGLYNPFPMPRVHNFNRTPFSILIHVMFMSNPYLLMILLLFYLTTSLSQIVMAYSSPRQNYVYFLMKAGHISRLTCTSRSYQDKILNNV